MSSSRKAGTWPHKVWHIVTDIRVERLCMMSKYLRYQCNSGVYPDIEPLTCTTWKSFCRRYSFIPMLNYDTAPDIEKKTSISGWQRRWKLHIVPGYRSCFLLHQRVFFDIEQNNLLLKVAKTLESEHPQYRTRYSTRYRCWYMIISAKTGPSAPRVPFRDSKDDK